MSGVGVIEYALSGAVVVGVTGYWVWMSGEGARRAWLAEQIHRRTGRARTTAVEASLDDEEFSPDAIEAAVTDMFDAGTLLWRDPGAALRARPDAARIRGWARSRQAALGVGLRASKPSVDLLRVVRRPDAAEDRAVVRVRCRFHRQRPPHAPGPDSLRPTGHAAHLDERWTLGRDRGRWVLLSTDGDPKSAALLRTSLVSGAAGDDERLREQSLSELARQEAPQSDQLADIIDPDKPAQAALMDLSVVDGRFDPQLIESAVRHLVEAWEEATTGSTEPLSRLTSPEAAMTLLHPSGGDHGLRLVVRDARLEHWSPRSVVKAAPPRVVLDVVIAAVRYVVEEDTNSHIAGNDRDERPISIAWTLELVDSEPPWRLTESTDPTDEIPGL